MIAMSHVGRGITRRLLWACGGVLLLAALGCGEQVCTLKGCLEGLIVSLDGKFEIGSTYRVEVNQVIGADVQVVMSCSWGGSGTAVVCTSPLPHNEFGNQIHIRSNDLTKVKVAVMKGDVFLGEESFEPKYVAREINGEGCGTCTQASISVTVPKS